MTDQTPVQLLRDAAGYLHTLAENASPGQWQATASVTGTDLIVVSETEARRHLVAAMPRYPHSGRAADTNLIAAMNPGVARILVRLLTDVADGMLVEQRDQPETSTEEYAIQIAQQVMAARALSEKV